MSESSPVRVTLVTRVGCHLCEQAQRDLAAAGIDVRLLDVDDAVAVGDEALRARWSEEVPVVLVDGRQLGWGRVDLPRLRLALAVRRWRPWG